MHLPFHERRDFHLVYNEYGVSEGDGCVITGPLACALAKVYYSSVSFHADELTMFPSSRTAATLSLARELKSGLSGVFLVSSLGKLSSCKSLTPLLSSGICNCAGSLNLPETFLLLTIVHKPEIWLSDLCSPATVPCKGRQRTSLFGKFSCSGSFLEDIQDTFCFPTFLDFSFLLAESEGFAARPKRGIIGTGGTAADFDFIFVLFCCLVSVQCSLKLVNFGTMRGLVTVDEDKLKSLASDATIFVVVELAEQLS